MSDAIEFIHGPLGQDPRRVSKPLHDELEGVRGPGAASTGSSCAPSRNSGLCAWSASITDPTSTAQRDGTMRSINPELRADTAPHTDPGSRASAVNRDHHPGETLDLASASCTDNLSLRACDIAYIADILQSRYVVAEGLT